MVPSTTISKVTPNKWTVVGFLNLISNSMYIFMIEGEYRVLGRTMVQVMHVPAVHTVDAYLQGVSC